MSNRLLVNAGTPQAWEIQLRPGLNRIGRGAHNDFVITHPSVSGSHCEIIVSPGGVTLKDLGSTNGTFIGVTKVSETNLRNGQRIRFGQVDLLFEETTTVPAPTATVRVFAPPSPAASTAPTPSPESPSFPTVRISKPGLSIAPPPSPTATLAPTETTAPPPGPAIGHSPGDLLPRDMGPQFCRFHKNIHAHFHCDRCQKSYCDLCVNTTQEGDRFSHTCRSCGNECVALLLKKPPVRKEGFLKSIPGAFVYPFRGSGVLIIIIATVIFGLLNWFSPRTQYGFIPATIGRATVVLYILKFIAAGYLFAFLQNIINATAVGEKELPDLPSLTDFASDIVFPALEFLGLVTFCFGPAIVMMVAGLFSGSPALIGIGALLLIPGAVYFPMAFLAVTIMNSILAVNPLFGVASILRIPGAYAVAALLLIGVYLFRWLGGIAMTFFSAQAVVTESMGLLFTIVVVRAVWGLLSFYLMIVGIRILGLLYFHKKQSLGWLSR